jgi:hypothetical protein
MNTTITLGELVLVVMATGIMIILYAAIKAAYETWLK